MIEWFVEVASILPTLFAGYCIQFFCGRFAEPKLSRVKGARWAVGIVWVLIRLAGGKLFWQMDSAVLVARLLFDTALLFTFCVCWYEGNLLTKVFLTVQFISLHELSFLAGYSFLYLGKSLIDLLAEGMGDSAVSVDSFLTAVNVLSCLSLVVMGTVKCTLLFASTRNIEKNCRDREKGRMGREVVFYLLPAIAGILVSVLVRLLFITITDGVPVLLYERYPALYLIIPMIALVLLGASVYSFQIYQDMKALQEEQAEKMVLENQIAQMQSSIVEMEHLYDGIRAVKHDMKNQMAVLQNLIRKRDGGEEDEIRQYFEGMYQSVEQLDSRAHTGNAVSDAVIENKFRYAAKQVKGIRLDASGFMLPDAVAIEAYDMGIILNNGLDNAIEASVRMREKCPEAEAYIIIRSFVAKNMYFIEIENSFDGMALYRGDGGMPLSTKEDKEAHGIGLKNIRKCAVKYGGGMNTKKSSARDRSDIQMLQNDFVKAITQMTLQNGAANWMKLL